jgi:hypothetical protein
MRTPVDPVVAVLRAAGAGDASFERATVGARDRAVSGALTTLTAGGRREPVACSCHVFFVSILDRDR